MLIVKTKMPRKTDDQENEDLKRIFGRRLRELRGPHTTQQEFAEKLGINQAMLSRLEKGYADPPLKVLVKLSEMTSIGKLIRGLKEQ